MGNSLDRRIQTRIASGSNPAQTVQYLYEGSQALGEIRDGKLSHRLLTGLKLDETIARIALNSSGQKDNAGSRIYLTDALNSVIAQLSDDNANPGSLQNSYGFSPLRSGQHGRPGCGQQPDPVHQSRKRAHRLDVLPGPVLRPGSQAIHI